MRTKQLFVLGLLGSFIVAGCNHKAEWNEALVDETLQNEKMSRRQDQREQRCESDVIYLKQASVDDVSDYVVSCGKSHKASCVVICHVPPGNPEAQHTIVVGLPALHAHMNHGSHGHHHGKISDYLGECRDLSELPPCEEEPTPTTTTTTLPPAPTTTTTTTSTTTTMPPVPTTTSTTTTMPPVPTTTTSTTTTTLPPPPTTTTTTSTTTTTTTTSTTTTTLPSGGECVPSDEIFVCP